jgi:beclin 1
MKLIPQGSFSRVEWDGTQYELYGSNDLSIGRILRDRRFDTAMVGFLRCLKVC